MKLTFCGAAREVTGSCHLITLDDGYTILLDCGLYQGREEHMQDFNREWLFEPHKINCMILSHAHIDHSGRIPKLVRDGFRGQIYCTHATRSLSAIMLLDSAQIQEEDTRFINKRARRAGKKERQEPLYTVRDVPRAMQQFISYSYEHWFKVHPKVEVMFRDAGHILGSATVNLRIREGGRVIRFAFSGDLGRPNRPILRDPLPMPDADYLICESTYGDQEHASAPGEEFKFLNIIYHTCLEKRGKLIIPAFSVGRTQEILYLLNRLSEEGKLPRIPVYIDSPLSIDATHVFQTHPECFDEELSAYMVHDKNPFGFRTLRYIRDVRSSKRLNSTREACIIISSSGMMNAGRVKHHLFNSIENARNTILIVGYCTPETPGGQLRAGTTQLELFGEQKQVLAEIEIMDSFSAHGDRKEMLDILRNQQNGLKKMFLVHGEYDRQEKWRDYLRENGFGNASIVIPSLGQEYELD